MRRVRAQLAWFALAASSSSACLAPDARPGAPLSTDGAPGGVGGYGGGGGGGGGASGDGGGCGDGGDVGENSAGVPGHFIWGKRFGDSGAQYSAGVAADVAGYVVIAGTFEGTVDFGGIPLTSEGDTDIFVAKFERDGTHYWSRQYGGPGPQMATHVAVNPDDGTVYVAGDFLESITLEGQAFPAAGKTDVFLLKLDHEGTFAWHKRWGGAQTEGALAVAVDASSNVAVTGAFEDAVDFGAGAFQSGGERDVFLVKLDSNGTLVFGKSFGDAADQVGRGVGFDTGGNIALVGDFRGSIDLGAGALSAVGGADGFAARFDAGGAHTWSRATGASPGDDSARAIAVNSTMSQVYVLGGYETADLDLGSGNLPHGGGADIFVARLDWETGAPQASAGFGGPGDQTGRSVTLDTAGAVLFAGDYDGSITFGGRVLDNPCGAGASNIFAARLNVDLSPIWSVGIGSAAKDISAGITVIPETSKLYMSGSFGSAVDVGPWQVSSAGGFDVFLAKLRLVP